MKSHQFSLVLSNIIAGSSCFGLETVEFSRVLFLSCMSNQASSVRSIYLPPLKYWNFSIFMIEVCKKNFVALLVAFYYYGITNTWCLRYWDISVLTCHYLILLQSLRGHSCAREVQRNFFHKWLETYLRCKKIEGDRLKSWCGPRNPRWRPRWRPIFLKMTVYIKLATTTCFYFVFGLKMIILENNRYKKNVSCHFAMAKHQKYFSGAWKP